jgi:hypothetical protein
MLSHDAFPKPYELYHSCLPREEKVLAWRGVAYSDEQKQYAIDVYRETMEIETLSSEAIEQVVEESYHQHIRDLPNIINDLMEDSQMTVVEKAMFADDFFVILSSPVALECNGREILLGDLVVVIKDHPELPYHYSVVLGLSRNDALMSVDDLVDEGIIADVIRSAHPGICNFFEF